MNRGSGIKSSKCVIGSFLSEQRETLYSHICLTVPRATSKWKTLILQILALQLLRRH